MTIGSTMPSQRKQGSKKNPIQTIAANYKCVIFIKKLYENFKLFYKKNVNFTIYSARNKNVTS